MPENPAAVPPEPAAVPPEPAPDSAETGPEPEDSTVDGAPDMPVDRGRAELNSHSWILIALGTAFLVGGFCVYFGFGGLPRDRHNISLLIACIGFAIVLTEIGTRAAVQHTSLNTGIVVTGAGALALIFYILVNPIALCQFGYGDNCPQPETVRKFTGKVKIIGDEPDPRALTLAVVPQTRSTSLISRNELSWTAKFPVHVNDDGNVDEPELIILSYPKRPPLTHSVPVHLDAYTYSFDEVLEFALSEPKEESRCDGENCEIRLGD